MKKHTYRSMMVSALVGAMTVCGIAQATPYYWDTDDTIGGFGNASGVWGTSAFWSPDITGASASALTTIGFGDAVNFGTATLALGATAANVGVGTVNVGTITFGAGQTTPVVLSSGTITLAAAATITVNNTSDTISSILAGAATSVTKDGTGTLTLSGNNTYAGATTVSVGTIKAGSATGLSANSAFSVAAGATLDLGGYTNTIKSLGVGTATSTITDSSAAGSGGMLKVTTALSAANAGLFTGSLGLQVYGGGNVLGNANSTYSGGTIIGNGSGGATRWLGSGSIGTGTPGALTKGYFGTGPITIGVNATDKSQFYCSGATTINNAIVVNSSLGDGSSFGAFRVEPGILTIAGTINANLADVMFQAQNGGGRAATVTGAISGNSGLQVYVQGAGGITVTLNNTGTANSYAGNTTINSANATLTLGAANQIPNGTGKGNLSNSGTFNMGGFSETINGLSGSGIVDGVSGTPTLTVGDNDANSTFSGVIKNAAGILALVKTGNGTLILSGTNTYSGSTTINAGRLQGVVGGGCANSTVILNAATATNSVSITDNTKAWTNAALTVSAAGVLEFNFGAITPSTTLSPLTITGVAAFTATPTVSVIVSASSLAAGTYPLMTWSSTSGTAPTTANLIAALPAGTVGSLSVSGNTLNLVVVSYVAYWDNNGAAAGFGTASGIWASPTTGDATQGWSLDTTGGTLPADYTTTSTNLVNFGNGATGLGAGTITVSGVVTNGGMTFASGSGAVTLSGGTITLPAAGTITVNNTSDTISSALAGAGISLTKAGIGTLTLSGNNTYSGATTNSAGTLKAGSTTGLSANSAFSVAAGSTLDLGGYNNTIKSLGVDTATSIITNSTGSATLKVSTALGGTALPQVFTGSLGLQIFGGGLNTLLANANNTYSGGTILGIGSGTTLTRPGISGTIGTGSPGAVTKGNFGTGPITFGAAATDRSQFYMLGAATINNAIVVNTAQGDGSQLGAFRLEAGGGLLTIAGPVNANLADVVFEANNNLGMIGTVTGAISGSSGLQVLAQNNGGLIVTLASSANTNSYAGNTIITNSSANVNAYATLTLGAANQIPNGTGKGNLIVMGGSFKMGGFSETINGLSGSGIVDGVSGTPTLTVGDNDATGTTNTFSGVIKNTAGTLSLIKIGSGTLTLSGTNTYSGATAVSNGTLSVNGSLTNANITVAAGATLTGSGTIRCRVSVSTNDLITVSGTATLSNLTLALDVQGILPIGSYVLAKGLDAAQFKAVTGTPQNATKWSNVTYVNGQLVLVVSDKGTMISVF